MVLYFVLVALNSLYVFFIYFFNYRIFHVFLSWFSVYACIKYFTVTSLYPNLFTISKYLRVPLDIPCISLKLSYTHRKVVCEKFL